MSYGFEVHNASGSVVLDTNTAGRITYLYKASGTITTGNSASTGANFSFGSASLQTINANNTLLVFVRPKSNSEDIKVYGTPINNGAGFIIYSYPGNKEFDYIAFEVSTDKPKATSGYGIEVYDTNDEVIFSSQFMSTRVRALLQGSGSTYSESNTTLYASLFQAPSNSTGVEESPVLFKHTTSGNMLRFNADSSISIINDVMRYYSSGGSSITYNYYSNVYDASKSIIIDTQGITL
jgi:hypothetical protein